MPDARPLHLAHSVAAPLAAALLVAAPLAGCPSVARADDLPAAPRVDRARSASATDGRHQSGAASYYANRFSGRKTASGDRYDPKALTAAHRTLPLGTRVRVVNPKNDKSVVVTVNDRGPVAPNRMIDVSSAAADALDMKKSGVTRVRTEVVGKGDAGTPGAN